MHLRDHRVPVSLRELLDLLRAMRLRLAFANLEQFYFLARLCLVKDEKFYDRFDLAFDSFFRGLDGWQATFDPVPNMALLKETLARLFPGHSEADLARLLQEYRQELDAARKRHDDQRRDNGELSGKEAAGRGESRAPKEEDEPEHGEEWRPDLGEKSGGRHEPANGGGEQGDGEQEEGDEDGEGEDGETGEGEGGREGEGTNGETGLGSGDEPGQGVRDDTQDELHRSATRVWQMREFADYDPEVELGTRNMKLALRRLRKFARTSAELELDLAGTIASTARNGGILDIKEVPERHNAVKVLLFLDVGGSMDEHIERCAQLFSAARSEFKYLEYYYFHNFIYESVWHDNDRRSDDRVPTFDILHRFGSDYKIIFVGDASMGRHEIAEKGGSVEHYNSEPGEVWLSRLQERFKKVVWLNPVDPRQWNDVYSIAMIRRLMSDRMYHLSVDGIEQAMKFLAR